ncbi:hypothetical protein WJX73_004614 [Symbiochloris irregularis]|uniref:Exonuclease domain-containing protein n=1 Tax=Symbiochloris irregularis TaxID=706552 RepID=A0AAW1NQW5_9CHLO
MNITASCRFSQARGGPVERAGMSSKRAREPVKGESSAYHDLSRRDKRPRVFSAQDDPTGLKPTSPDGSSFVEKHVPTPSPSPGPAPPRPPRDNLHEKYRKMMKKHEADRAPSTSLRSTGREMKARRRLMQQAAPDADEIVYLDVEGGGDRKTAKVVLLNGRGALLFAAEMVPFKSPEPAEGEQMPPGSWKRSGCRPLARRAWVREELRRRISGRYLGGHAVTDDLARFGLQDLVPTSKLRDTGRYGVFRQPSQQGGTAMRKLKDLAKVFLNITIQAGSGQHDPFVDADTCRRLYLLKQKAWERAIVLGIEESVPPEMCDAAKAPKATQSRKRQRMCSEDLTISVRGSRREVRLIF